MGQKTHPLGFRLGYIKTWNSRWFAKKGYAAKLHEDLAIREYVKRELGSAAISKVEIERYADRVVVNVWSARPGMIIGSKGARIGALRGELKDMVGSEVDVEIREIENAELDAQLVAESIAEQLVRRMGFRRVMKKTLSTVMKLGAKGCRIQIQGRIGGAEMSRKERYAEGRVPLHTLRADIDYGQAIAKTAYGVIGTKVWIFRDEVLPGDVQEGSLGTDAGRRPVKKKRRGGAGSGRPGGGRGGRRRDGRGGRGGEAPGATEAGAGEAAASAEG